MKRTVYTLHSTYDKKSNLKKKQTDRSPNLITYILSVIFMFIFVFIYSSIGIL